MIVGDTNPSTLASNLHFLYHPKPEIRIETKVQTGAFPFAPDVLRSVGLLELLGKSSTISLALYSPKRDSGKMTIGFLHSINDNFCAGAELLVAWSAKSRMEANVALAGRFVRSIAFLLFGISKTFTNKMRRLNFRRRRVFTLAAFSQLHFHIYVINCTQIARSMCVG